MSGISRIKNILTKVKEGKKSEIVAGILRRAYFRSRPPNGVKVVEEDWDYLVILDACRYDVFKEVYDEVDWLEGDLSKETSRGSMSLEFFNRNFTGYYDDIVYLSANGFVHKPPGEAHYARKHFIGEEHFHEVYKLFLDESIQETNVCTPEGVTEKAIEASEKHEDKRLVLHYMQPHGPYIGEGYKKQCNFKQLIREEGPEKAKEYYKANLKRALDSIRNLMDEVEGKFVITADHAELFEEWGMIQHPHSVYVPKLIEVPWLEVQNGERRQVKREEALYNLDY